MTVRSRDNGGTARGGDDLSPIVEFTITIMKAPTPEPTEEPTESPTEVPSEAPVASPSTDPTLSDGALATAGPSPAPTEPPVGEPTATAGNVPWAVLFVVALAGVLAFGGGMLLPRFLGKRRSP